MNAQRLAVILTTGALAATGLSACGSSTTSSGAGASASSTTAAQSSVASPTTGGPPAGGPGMGAPVTGTAAAKASAAATAKYPGSVEKILKSSDGSYQVHVITTSGEKHVAVSKSFEVTGVDQGGPGGAPPVAPAAGTAS